MVNDLPFFFLFFSFLIKVYILFTVSLFNIHHFRQMIHQKTPIFSLFSTGPDYDVKVCENYDKWLFDFYMNCWGNIHICCHMQKSNKLWYFKWQNKVNRIPPKLTETFVKCLLIGCVFHKCTNISLNDKSIFRSLSSG